MEVFKIFGTIGLNKAQVMTDMAAVETRASGLGSKLGAIFAKVGALIVSVFAVKKIADFVSGSVKEFASFETAVAHMFADMGDTSQESRERIVSDIRTIAREYGIMATDVVNATEAALDLDLPTDRVDEFMSIAAELSKVLGVDLTTASSSLAKTVQLLGGNFDDTRQIADMLFAGVEAGGGDLETLGTQLGRIAPLTEALGMDIRDVVAAITTLTAQGIPSRTALGGIQGAIEELDDSTSKVSKTFQALSGQTIREFIASGGNLQGVLELLGPSVADLFTNVEAGKAVFSLTGEHAAAFTKRLDDQKSGVISLSGAWAGLSTTLGEQFKRLQQWWNDLQIDIGGKLKEPLEGLIKFLDDNKEKIKTFIITVAERGIALLQWIIDNKNLVVAAIGAIALAVAGKAVVSWIAWVAQLAKAHPYLMALALIIGGVVTVLNLLSKGAQDADTRVLVFRKGVEQAVDTLFDMERGLRNVTKYSDELKGELNALADVVAASGGSVAEMTAAWNAGAAAILARYAEIYPELDRLRDDYIQRSIETTVKGAQAQAEAIGEIPAEAQEKIDAQPPIGIPVVVPDIDPELKEINDRITASIEKFSGATAGSLKWAAGLKELQAEFDELNGYVEWAIKNNVSLDESVFQAMRRIREQGVAVTETAAAFAVAAAGEMPEWLKPEEARTAKTAYDELKGALEALDVNLARLIETREREKKAHQEAIGLVGVDRERVWELSKTIEDAEVGTREYTTAVDELRSIYGALEAAVATATETNKEADPAILKLMEDIRKMGVVVDEAKTAWENFATAAGNAVGNFTQSLIDEFAAQEQLSEDHNANMAAIADGYTEDATTAYTSREDALEAAEKAHKRKLRDIETDYQRQLTDSTGKSREEIAKIETDHMRDIEDAETDYGRRRADIQQTYTEEMKRLGDEEIAKVKEEKEAYEAAHKTIGQVLWDTLKATLGALKEELWVFSAGEAAKALAYGAAALLGGLWAAPLAAQHGAAAATAAGEAAALSLGGYFLGFKKGAVFEQPTLLPPSLIAEAGPEAFLPLSEETFAGIGKGISEAMRIGGGASIQVDMRGLYEGATIQVRDDTDITKIARELYDLLDVRMRARGLAIA